jgi:hypothetical protein
MTMNGVVWKYNYRFDGKYRYYNGGNTHSPQDVGLSAFVINELNRSRQQLVLSMSNTRRQAEATVRRMSRVDTGLMKSEVTGTGDFGTDILKISFGWESNSPYYAPFQEFGTSKGIEPMMAVATAYVQAVDALRKSIGK